jgi:replicative DNA helicase
MTLGLPAIDQCIRLFPGVLIQVLGTTSVGKTALVMNMLYHLNKHNYASLLISLEQAEQMITERFLQRSLRKDSMKLTETFSNYETARRAALKAAGKMPNIFICDESVVTVESTKMIMDEVYNKYGKRLSVVAIDYVQLMKGSSSSRYDRMTEIAQAEKRIAKDMGITLISLSQIGRKLKPTDPVTLNTAKETGQIEEGADILLGAWQKGKKPGVI